MNRADQAVANKKLLCWINSGGAASLAIEALAEGADPRSTNIDGESALSQAIRLGASELCAMLVGAYPEMAREPLPMTGCISPLFYACSVSGRACVQSVRALLPLSDLDLLDQAGRSPMRKAILETNGWHWNEMRQVVMDIEAEYWARGRGMDAALELEKSLESLDESGIWARKLDLPLLNESFRGWLKVHGIQALDRARMEKATPLAGRRGPRLRV